MNTLSDKGFTLGKQTLLPAQKNALRIAMDAAIPMVTAANLGIPEMFATYLDPEVVEILTAPLVAEELFPAAKVGNWADQQTIFPEEEAVGTTQPYSDFGKGATTDVNYNWPKRDIYRFQTFIEVGDYEQELSAAAKIDLLSRKQKAAARVIAIDRNDFELFGVSGLSIYGILNDPNLPSATSPTVENSNTDWESKSATAIYNDILAIFSDIQDRTGGLVKFDTPMVLAVPPELNAFLTKVTSLGVAPVMELIGKYFPNLKVVPVAQLKDGSGVCSIMLIPQVLRDGEKVGRCGIVENLRTSRVVLEHTSMSQKWSSATAGSLLYRPMAVGLMTGLQKS